MSRILPRLLRHLAGAACLTVIFTLPAAARKPDLAGLAAYTETELQLAVEKSGRGRAQLVLAGSPVTLLLEPVDLRATGFRLLVAGAGGVELQEPPPPRTVRGSVAGNPASSVRGSITGHGFAGLVRANGGAWYVEPLRRYLPQASPEAHVVYRPLDVAAAPLRCGTRRSMVETADLPADAPAPVRRVAVVLAEIALDADFERFQLDGSDPQATLENMEQILNLVTDQYERELGITYRISASIIRTVEPDPYRDPDQHAAGWVNADNLMEEFMREWRTNQVALPRDVAHLFTGKNLGYQAPAGLAYLGSVCDPYRGYGFSGNGTETVLALRQSLTAHELGHSWRAEHCDDSLADNFFAGCCGPPSYTMCSYLGSDPRNKFCQPSLSVMGAFRDSLDCLSEVTPGGVAADRAPALAILLALLSVAAARLPAGTCFQRATARRHLS
ncbi:MAG: hypothetical protein HYV63_12285 [Candidatus Schekmanbacteria bacterium]|nr:hypothetical protein [Candidatus Schekmanbacteria bacterium]